MKQFCLLAGFASILFSCNYPLENTTAATTSNTKKKHQINEVKETMDKMMHVMHGTKPTGNNDIDFATMMVAHHKGAVDMSEIERNKGNDAALKAFAQKVVIDQNKEILFMQELIATAPKTTSPNSTDFQKALNNAMLLMMNHTIPIYHDIDKDFAVQMIPHHQSAVDMAKAYLGYGKENSLRTLCQNIIHSQTKEINWFKEWLAKHKE